MERNISSSPSPLERNRSGSNPIPVEREGDAFTTGRQLLMEEIDEHHLEHAVFHSPPGSLAPSPYSGSPALPAGPVTVAHSIDAHAHHTDYNRQVPISAAISLGVKAAGGSVPGSVSGSYGGSPTVGMSLSTSPTPKGAGGFMHNDLLAGSPPGSPSPSRAYKGVVAAELQRQILQLPSPPPARTRDDEGTPELSPRTGRKMPSSILSPDAQGEAEHAEGTAPPDASELAEYHEMMALAEEIRLKEEKHAGLAQLGEHLHGVDLGGDRASGEHNHVPEREPGKSIVMTPYKKRLRQLQRGRHPVNITFAEGTAGPSMDSLAVGIVKHEMHPAGNFMEYTVQLWQNGRSWLLVKRYSHFQAFQAELSAEYGRLLADKAAIAHASRAAAQSREYMTDEQLVQIARFEEMARRTSLNVPEDRRPSSDQDSGGSSSGHGRAQLPHMITQSGAAMLLDTEEDLPLPELPKKRWFETQRWLNRFVHF